MNNAKKELDGAKKMAEYQKEHDMAWKGTADDSRQMKGMAEREAIEPVKN